MRMLVRIFICFLIVLGVFVSLPAAGGSEGDSLSVRLPSPGEIEGWRRDGERLVYHAENLWEYINGAAENFLTYEFQSVTVQDYLSDTGKGLKVEIYDHANPLMAFGIYSQFRGEGLIRYELGNDAVGDAYSLHFWKGSYYVRINVFEESEELGEVEIEAPQWLQDLQEMVQMGVQVVVVASGRRKAEIARVAINAGYANVFIIDGELARALLKSEQQSS